MSLSAATTEANWMRQPKDAQYVIGGLYYKIGIHSKPFMYVNGAWILSQRDVTDITSRKRVDGK